MRRTMRSQKALRPTKPTSKEARVSNKKTQSTIDGFHAYLSSVNIGHVGCDFEWLLEQEQILSRLNNSLARIEPSQDDYKIKLRSCESILHNIREKVIQTKLNSVDIPFINSTHHTSCEAKLRQRTLPIGSSVEKLKQTVPSKPGLLMKNNLEHKTPTNEVISDCERRSTALERQSKQKQGTYQKFKPNRLPKNVEIIMEIEQATLAQNKELQTQLVEALQGQTRLQELVRKLEKESGDYEALRRELTHQTDFNKQLQLRITTAVKEFSQCSQKESARIQTCLAINQKESESLRAQNRKLSSENQYLIGQANKHIDTIAQLNGKVTQLEQQLDQLDTSRQAALVNSKQRQVDEKQAIIRELIYEKENYSDGYAQLRKQKSEHLEAIKRLESTISELRSELQDLQEKHDALRDSLKQSETDKLKLNEQLCFIEKENHDLKCSIKDLRLELRQNRLELCTAEQKAELFQQRYYKLRQNSTDEEELARTLTQKELSRSSKIITDRSRPICTHEKSTEREDQGRRIKALSDLKVLVKNHRLNISSGLR